MDNRSPTPPPFVEISRDDEGDPHSWYWEPHGGGMVLNFGKYRGRRMNEVSLRYLRWCHRTFKAPWTDHFRGVFEYYQAGLEGLVENEYDRFIVPFGKKHRGKTIRQCRDKPWLLWAMRQPRLTEDHPLFFTAVRNWVNNPRKYGATRDVGELLSATEYQDDLNLANDGNGHDGEEEPTQSDLDFIDDSFIEEENSSSDQDSSDGDDIVEIQFERAVESDNGRSPVSASDSLATLGSQDEKEDASGGHEDEQASGEEDEEDEGNGQDADTEELETPFVIDEVSTDGEGTYVDSELNSVTSSPSIRMTRSLTQKTKVINPPDSSPSSSRRRGRKIVYSEPSSEDEHEVTNVRTANYKPGTSKRSRRARKIIFSEPTSEREEDVPVSEPFTNISSVMNSRSSTRSSIPFQLTKPKLSIVQKMKGKAKAKVPEVKQIDKVRNETLNKKAKTHRTQRDETDSPDHSENSDAPAPPSSSSKYRLSNASPPRPQRRHRDALTPSPDLDEEDTSPCKRSRTWRRISSEAMSEA